MIVFDTFIFLISLAAFWYSFVILPTIIDAATHYFLGYRAFYISFGESKFKFYAFKTMIEFPKIPIFGTIISDCSSYKHDFETFLVFTSILATITTAFLILASGLAIYFASPPFSVFLAFLATTTFIILYGIASLRPRKILVGKFIVQNRAMRMQTCFRDWWQVQNGSQSFNLEAQTDETEQSELISPWTARAFYSVHLLSLMYPQVDLRWLDQIEQTAIGETKESVIIIESIVMFLLGKRPPGYRERLDRLTARAIEIQPDLKTLYGSRCAAFVESERFEEALALSSQADESDVLNRCLNALIRATAYYRLDRMAEAVEQYEFGLKEKASLGKLSANATAYVERLANDLAALSNGAQRPSL